MIVMMSHRSTVIVLSFFINVFLECTVAEEGIQIPWPPKENYTMQPTDHFSFPPYDTRFRLRYLYEDRWHKSGGPIFFYCGNEGPIESFWNNTGFLFQQASAMGAFIIFAEHRYYGKSLPFFKSFEQPYIQYLSINQALADYAYLIEELQTWFGPKPLSVVTFGGSYGGMLAAYMRVLYPHLVTGAIASSAPVKWLAGEGNFHEFFESVTEDFAQSKPNCSNRIREAYRSMERLKAQRAKGIGLLALSKQLRLCTPMRNQLDYQWMLKWTRNAFVMMAMLDYPSASNFMGNLPAYPVNVSCTNAMAQSNPVDSMREAIGVFYNSSKALPCFDYKQQYIECADITGCGLGNDSLAWDFQSCNEMNLFDGSGSTDKDMFPSLPLTKDHVTAYCQRKWGVTPTFSQLKTFFGAEVWKSASNIIFSNGNLDPWMRGGVLHDVSTTVRALILHGGAHHLDLRMEDKNDPPYARIVRQAETDAILSWIKQHY